MIRRSGRNRLGIYRRDGRIVFGRTPFLSDEDRAGVENPTRLTRGLQFLGLVYRPDRTRRTWFGFGPSSTD